jgi:hypothetical protein
LILLGLVERAVTKHQGATPENSGEVGGNLISVTGA